MYLDIPISITPTGNKQRHKNLKKQAYHSASTTTSLRTSQFRSSQSNPAKVLQQCDLGVNVVDFDLGAVEVEADCVVPVGDEVGEGGESFPRGRGVRPDCCQAWRHGGWVSSGKVCEDGPWFWKDGGLGGPSSREGRV